MVLGLTATARSTAIILSLFVKVASALVFFFATNGFYGTLAASRQEALNPPTIAPSDDVYLCSQLNGMGSDDDINMLFLVLLMPLVAARFFRFRDVPRWREVMLLGFLSMPSLLCFRISYCADIALTVLVGHNVALVTGLAGWLATFLLYVMPSQSAP